MREGDESLLHHLDWLQYPILLHSLLSLLVCLQLYRHSMHLLLLHFSARRFHPNSPQSEYQLGRQNRRRFVNLAHHP